MMRAVTNHASARNHWDSNRANVENFRVAGDFFAFDSFHRGVGSAPAPSHRCHGEGGALTLPRTPARTTRAHCPTMLKCSPAKADTSPMERLSLPSVPSAALFAALLASLSCAALETGPGETTGPRTAVAVPPGAPDGDTWRGIAVAPERRCSPYDRGDYPYPRSIENDIVAAMGGRVFCPYTGESFRSKGETDIEHIVSLSEAHDSGLCAAGPEAKRRFATDMANLTLAPPRLNRWRKGARDAAEWLPDKNRCWYAGRIVAVKRAHALTVDAAEARALEGVLSRCPAGTQEPWLLGRRGNKDQ